MAGEAKTSGVRKRPGFAGWALRIAVVIAVALVILAAGLAALINMPGGQKFLAARVTGALSVPGERTVSVEEVGGFWPYSFTLRGLKVSDADGVWLEIDKARLAWAPVQFVFGRVVIDEAGLNHILVHRRPLGGEEKDGSGFSLPDTLIVRHFSAEELELAAPVLGQPARLRIAGRIAQEAGSIANDVTIRRLDGAGLIKLSGHVSPATGAIAIKAEASEPPGGVVATALGRPGAGALTANIAVNGTFDDLTATVDAGLDGVGALKGTAKGGLKRGQELTFGATWESPELDQTGGLAVLVAAGEAKGRLYHGPSGGVTIGDLDVTGAFGRLTGDAGFGPSRGGSARDLFGALSLRLSERMVAGLPVDFDAGGSQAVLMLDGTLDDPMLTLDGETADFRAAGIGADRVVLRVALAQRGEGPQRHWQAAIAATANALSGPPIVEDLSAGGLNLDGSLSYQGGDWATLTPLHLTGERFDAQFNGAMAGGPEGLAGTLTARIPDLAALSDLAGMAEGGDVSVKLELTPAGEKGGLTGQMTAAATGLRYSRPALAKALGPDVDASARLALGGAGGLTVTDIDAKARNGAWRATGSVTLPAGETAALTAEAQIEAAQWTALLDGTIDAASGPAHADINFSGRPGARKASLKAEVADMRVGESAFGEVAVSGEMQETATGWSGPLTMRSSGAAGMSQADAQVSFAGGGQWSVDMPEAKLFGVDVSADFVHANDRTTGKGRFAAADLSVPAQALLPAFGMADLFVGGKLSGEAELPAGSGVRFRLEGDGINAEQADGSGFAVAHLSASNGAAGQLLSLQLQGADLNGMPVETASLAADGDAEAFTVTAAWSQVGAGQGEGGAEARGSLREKHLTLTRADLSGATGGFALAGPAEIGWKNGLALSPVEITLRDSGGAAAGTVSLAAQMPERGLKAQARVSDLKLSLVRLFLPLGPVAGTLDAEADLDTMAGARRATLEATVRGHSEFEAADEPKNILFTLTADWRGAEIVAASAMTFNGEELGTAQVSLPVRFSEGARIPQLAESQRISGRAAYNGSIAPLVLLAPGTDLDLEGQLRADLGLSGRFNAPTVLGDVALSRARLEHFTTGLVIEDLSGTARLTATDRTLQLAGRDPYGGSVTASILFGGDMAEGATKANLSLAKFRALQRDDIELTASGDIALKTGEVGLVAEGALTVDDAVFNIPKSSPPSIVELTVREVGGNRRERTVEKGRSVPVALDLTVKTDRDMRIAGRGLRSRWGGEVHVGGAARKPELTGDLNLSEGTFKFGPRTFDLTRGRIRFLGGTRINPSLLVRAEHQTDQDFIAILTVSGSASSPVVTVSSSPSQPQETVMAAILFGKEPSELTPTELLQLAQALSSASGLVGNGDGLLTSLETTLGLDTLDVGFNPQSETAAAGLSLTAGKRLSDNVMLRVTKGADAASTRVGVDLELTDSISATTDIHQDGSSAVGLQWSRDY